MFQSKITSQGTISIPAPLRKKYNLKPGEIVTLEDAGKITIVKTVDFADIRARNRSVQLKETTRNGSGFSAHVKDKYGS